MLTGAPPSDRASLPPAPRRRVWPWAAGSILITLAVIAATLVGHRLAAQARLASQVAPAPAAPPLAVEAIAHAPGPIINMALDTHTHTLVAQVQAVTCTPPTPLSVHCGPAVPSASGVVFYDSATGAVRAQHLTSPTDSGQAYVLTDTTRGVTYLLDPSGVTIFSDATGQQTGKYASQLAADAQSGALQTVALDERLGLIYALDNQGNLNAYAAVDGQQVTTTQTALLPTTAPGAQLVVDASAKRVYAYASLGGDTPATLYAFAAGDLTPLGSWTIQAGLSLGGLDPATHTLYLLAAYRNDWRLDLATLPANGSGQTVALQQDAQMIGENRFGIDHATGGTLLMTTKGVEAFASGATQPYAQLPSVSGSLTAAPAIFPWLLPIDEHAGLAYLPGDDSASNSILIVSLARPASHAAPNAATAALIARAGMAKLLPDTNQTPPFVTAQTFPLAAEKATRTYFILFSDLGWRGPYAGTASIGSVTAGATPGDYTMTFTITWNQLFLRQHSWTVEVTPDGATHLRAESGDAVP